MSVTNMHSGQDLGDAVWPVLDFGLSRLLRLATSLKVPLTNAASSTPRAPDPLFSLVVPTAQVSSIGEVTVQSTADGPHSRVDLSGGVCLGPEGGARLGRLTQGAQPWYLQEIDLRCAEQPIRAQDARNQEHVVGSFVMCHV